MEVFISNSATSTQTSKAKAVESRATKKIEALTKQLKEVKAGLKAAKAFNKKGEGTKEQNKAIASAFKHVQTPGDKKKANASKVKTKYAKAEVARKKRVAAQGPLFNLKPHALSKKLGLDFTKRPVKGGSAYIVELKTASNRRAVADIISTLTGDGFQSWSENKYVSGESQVSIMQGRGITTISIQKLR